VNQREVGRFGGSSIATSVSTAPRFLLKSSKDHPLVGFKLNARAIEDGRVWMTCECGAGLCHWLLPPLCYTPPSLEGGLIPCTRPNGSAPFSRSLTQQDPPNQHGIQTECD
jgi:hypothetical protein